jgi:ATP-dependent protease ClpP protease subunit
MQSNGGGVMAGMAILLFFTFIGFSIQSSNVGSKAGIGQIK